MRFWIQGSVPTCAKRAMRRWAPWSMMCGTQYLDAPSLFLYFLSWRFGAKFQCLKPSTRVFLFGDARIWSGPVWAFGKHKNRK